MWLKNIGQDEPFCLTVQKHALALAKLPALLNSQTVDKTI